MAAQRVGPSFLTPNAIADPGDTNSVDVTLSGYVPIVTAGTETRTLPIPLWVGQQITIYLLTDGGDCTLTVTNGWNQIGNTAIVFNDAGDSATFYGIAVGAALEWRLLSIDGAIAEPEITDPIDTGAIPVTASGVINLVTEGGAETRTLAIPTFLGQELQLNFHTDAGNCVITTATGANQTGNNTLTFADAGDHMILQGAQLGANLVWRIVANDGVALSTV